MFSPLPESIESIKGGSVRALAVTTAERSEALPDVPTVGDSVPGFEASTWQGIGAPKNTPPEIVERLNTEINAALADPKIKARLADLGSLPTPDVARRVRALYRGGNREVGEGDPGGEDYAAVNGGGGRCFIVRDDHIFWASDDDPLSENSVRNYGDT